MAKYYDTFELRGLRECLRSFENNGYSATRGRWKIGVGGYDLDWELYYDNYTIVDCYDDVLEFNGNIDDYPNGRKVIKVILQEYPDCKYLEKKYVVTYTDDSGIYDDDVKTYTEECDDYEQAKHFMEYLKKEGLVDIDYDTVYYDIDGNIVK